MRSSVLVRYLLIRIHRSSYAMLLSLDKSTNFISLSRQIIRKWVNAELNFTFYFVLLTWVLVNAKLSQNWCYNINNVFMHHASWLCIPIVQSLIERYKVKYWSALPSLFHVVMIERKPKNSMKTGNMWPWRVEQVEQGQEHIVVVHTGKFTWVQVVELILWYLYKRMWAWLEDASLWFPYPTHLGSFPLSLSLRVLRARWGSS